MAQAQLQRPEALHRHHRGCVPLRALSERPVQILLCPAKEERGKYQCLKLEHLCKTFNPGTINEKIALADLSLHLKPGDFVTVIGGNGAGKSTMLNAIAGVWAVDSGRMILDGEDITALPEHKRANSSAGSSRTP